MEDFAPPKAHLSIYGWANVAAIVLMVCGAAYLEYLDLTTPPAMAFEVHR